jgi:hypothetical protein
MSHEPKSCARYCLVAPVSLSDLLTRRWPTGPEGVERWDRVEFLVREIRAKEEGKNRFIERR